jgi:hypothetical protein
MSKSCPYCAQTNTRKDQYGYCKKYSCFYVSGNKEKYENLKKEMRETIFLPKMKRNMFDGCYYPKRANEQAWIMKKIQNLLGFVPLEALPG